MKKKQGVTGQVKWGDFIKEMKEEKTHEVHYRKETDEERGKESAVVVGLVKLGHQKYRVLVVRNL